MRKDIEKKQKNYFGDVGIEASYHFTNITWRTLNIGLVKKKVVIEIWRFI